MGVRPITLEQIKAIKQRHESDLLRLKGVVGVGIGLDDPIESQAGYGYCILVTINQDKIPAGLPSELEGAPVRVINAGKFRALGE